MHDTKKNDVENIICLALLVLFSYAVMTKTNYVQHKLHSYDWSMGDWLINYSAGFVRRGFGGQILIYLNDWFGLNIINVVLKIRFFLYQIIYIGFFLIAIKKKFGFIELILMASPWFFMFNINDELAVGRKEILLIAIFIVYIVIDLYTNNNLINIIYLLVMLPLITLSHEGMFFYFQFFGLYILLKNNGNIKKLTFFIIAYLISLLVVIICFFKRGTENTSKEICDSLLVRGINQSLCTGPIENISTYVNDYKTTSYLILFIILSVVIIPLIIYAKQTIKNDFITKALFYICISLIPIIPLFIIAADWGRWIYIGASLLFITLISTKEYKNIKFVYSKISTITFLILSFLYIFNWKIYHYAGGFFQIELFKNNFQVWIRSFNTW